MRFHANGPNIPDELLDARDNGEVVFFCGAGVSIPAGLPSFAELAQQLISDLGVPQNASSRRLLERALTEKVPEFSPPMDLILDILQREYGSSQVENAVSRKLRTPKKPNVSCHETILRLSTDSKSKPRLITTNFDLLFERARPKLKRYAPPSLPDLTQDPAFEGIVYLHGRVGRHPSERITQRIILGEGDFGRAYLADGWASEFLRQIITHYTVVLLGYSADDPPVRYMLKGVQSRPVVRSQQIYAFAEGLPGEIESRWAGRGVKAIPYQASSPQHPELWTTLHAWGERALDPAAWRTGVLELARRRPATLAAYQRGQVAALVRSAPGAKVFAHALPPPPAEWLCVFDAGLRYAEPRRDGPDRTEVTFEPLEAYGLDDDPPRELGGDQKTISRGVDLLSPITVDERGPNYTRLAGALASRGEQLPARLEHLAKWIANVANQTVTVWWAAGHPALHYGLQNQIEFTITREDYSASELVRKAWALLFEAYRQRSEPLRSDWYDLRRSLHRDGWSNVNFRRFSWIVRPQITASRPMFADPRPPAKPEADLSLRDIAHFELKFIERVDDQFAIPTDRLAAAIAAIGSALKHAASILGDLEDRWWRTPTLHPENKPGATFHSDAGTYFLWFARLYDSLCAKEPLEARRELLTWPAHEPFFFDKLRVWAWMKPDIASASEVAQGLLALSASEFWPRHYEREFLWTLGARWKDLPNKERQLIERRIIAGPAPFPDESKADHMRRKSLRAAVRLGWLQANGCALSKSTRQRLPGLRKADARWRPDFDRTADDSHESRSGWVRTEADPSDIADAPISEIIELAHSHSSRALGFFVEYRPFQGLIEAKPLRALMALSFEARHGRFPSKFWEQLVSHWPKSLSEDFRPDCRVF